MNKIYSTDSYLRDLSPIFGYITPNIFKIVNYFKRLFKKLSDIDFEVGIIEFLIQIPIFLFIFSLTIFMVITLTNGTEPERGYRFSSILTNSMKPAINPGSIIFIIPPKNISVGDIILFNEKSSKTNELSGRRLTHRIINEDFDGERSSYITKGDANLQPDPGYVSGEEILGKVFVTIPYIGYISYLTSTYWGLTLFLLIPVLLLIYSEVKIILKYLKVVKK